MDSLDRDTLSTLARHLGSPSVSILMPTHRAGAGKEQDRIRLKNLIRSAEETMRAGGARQAEIDALMRPAHELLGDAAFWRSSTDGVALFLARDAAYVLSTESPLSEHVSVSERFSIRPLLPAVHAGERFFVLALSKNGVRLMEAHDESIREVDLANVPTSLSDALRFDDFESHLQFHSRTPAGAGGKGRRSAVFHGHGGAPDVAKENLLRYFRMVDRGVHEHLHDSDVPLVLAGVDYLIPLYKDVNSYPHVVSESLSGSPDEIPPHQLHQRARELLAPHFLTELNRDRALLEAVTSSGGASHDLNEIIPAAHEGRVKVLFVPKEAHGWGHYDPVSGRIDLSDEPRPGDWDLADLAAAETLLHGGVVHAVPPSDDVVDAAAIFRY